MDISAPMVSGTDLRSGRIAQRTRRWSTEARAKFWLTLAMWGSSYLVFTLLSLLDPHGPFVEFAAMRGFVTVLGIGFCYGLHRLSQSLASWRPAKRAITLVVITPLISEIFAWINYFGFAWLHGAPMAFVVEDWAAAIRQVLLYTWFFLAWTGLYLAIEYSFRAREEQQRVSQLRIHAHRAKLEALANQINPHFLFNSLNSISALVLAGRTRDADAALCLLSNFFRETLCLDPVRDIPLAREIEMHRTYLAVEQLRYPDLVQEVDLPAELEDAAVPALILQPVVENAVKHGIARSKPPTSLRIEACSRDGRLVLRVRNAGQREPNAPVPLGHGIGLDNVRNRLRERFGDRQHLLARSQPDGFEVEISIPLSFA